MYQGLLLHYSRRYGIRKVSADSLAFFQTADACKGLSRRLNYAYGEGSAILEEARFYGRLRNLAVSQERYQQALVIFEAGKSKKGLAAAYIYKSFLIRHVTDSFPAKLHYLQTARQLAGEAGDARTEAQSLRLLADIHQQQGKYAEAIQELLTALELQKKVTDPNIMFTTDLLAHVLAISGNHKSSLQYAIASLDYCRKSHDTTSILTFYQRLANMYFDLRNYEKAHHYFSKALASASQDKGMAIICVVNMAECLILQQKYQQAFDVLSDGLKTYPVDGVVAESEVARLYVDLYYFTGQYKIAEEYLIKKLEHFPKIDFDLSWRAQMFMRAGQVYYQLKQYEKAAWYSDSAHAMARHLNSWPSLMESSHTLYKLDSLKGNYLSAMRHYQEYKMIADSIQRDVADKQAIELAVQYETDQKNSELAFLNDKARLQQETIEQGRLVRNSMIVGSVLLLLLLLVTFNRYRIKQRANRSLQEKQEEINRQNQALATMVEEEKKITNEKDKLLRDKEWLMKEINHRVKNNLQVVMSLLNTQSVYLKDETALNAIQASQHRVHAISLIHRKLYQTDHLLTVIDMSVYIKEITEYLADSLDVESRIQFSLAIDPIELDVAQAVPTGLIINEAITNAVKYAFPGKATGQIRISLCKTPAGCVELIIGDNGIGMPAHFNWQQTESLGMSLMQGLSKQLDGHLEVLNSNGLSIKVSFVPGPSPFSR